MLNFYYAVAARLRFFQPLWLILALASLCWLGYLLLLAPVEQSQRWQLTALVTFAFFLNVVLLNILFGQRPSTIVATGFGAKLLARLRYALQWLLAWLVTLLFIVILWLFSRVATAIIALLFSNPLQAA